MMSPMFLLMESSRFWSSQLAFLRGCKICTLSDWGPFTLYNLCVIPDSIEIVFTLLKVVIYFKDDGNTGAHIRETSLGFGSHLILPK